MVLFACLYSLNIELLLLVNSYNYVNKRSHLHYMSYCFYVMNTSRERDVFVPRDSKIFDITLHSKGETTSLNMK